MLEALRKPLLSAMREASQVASLHEHPVLAVASIVIPRLDLLSIFTRYSPYMDVNLWFSFTRRSMLGLGTAFECIGTGVDRFSFVSDSWHNIIKESVVNGGTPPVAFGGFRFDTASPMSSMWTGFMDGILIIPRITILQGEGEMDCCRIIAADYVPPEADITSRIESMLSTWSGLQGDWDMVSANLESRVAVLTPEDAKAQWHDLVQAALSSISCGPTKKIVVARMIRAKAEVPFFLPSILNRLCADNPKATIFTFSRKGTYFVGTTPETAVSSNGNISSTTSRRAPVLVFVTTWTCSSFASTSVMHCISLIRPIAEGTLMLPLSEMRSASIWHSVILSDRLRLGLGSTPQTYSAIRLR